jgi:hypothetical protein
MARLYQTTDLTLCPIPKGLAIVTATIRYRDLNFSLDPVALEHEILGRKGKIVRITQLSSDLWTLLGYRHDNDGASRPCPHGSLTLLKADQSSNPYSDAANYETNHSDDWDEESGSREEDTGVYKPPVPSNDEGFSGDDMRYRERTREPWLDSDEKRLLSYKNEMGMEWKDVCECFPDRSAGAVKLHYYTLRKKNS